MSGSDRPLRIMSGLSGGFELSSALPLRTDLNESDTVAC
jgi:hypothetical protein